MVGVGVPGWAFAPVAVVATAVRPEGVRPAERSGQTAGAVE